MAKKTKATAPGASGGAARRARAKPRERRELRFEPRASASATVVYVIGALGAFAMGAGAWGEFGSLVSDGGPEPFKYAPYVLAAGAVLIGVAIWIGTSGEPPLRVGDAGIAVERAGVRRMPWYAIERITWSEEAVRAAGKDDAGVSTTIVASVRSHGQAAAWIVKEARERVPAVVDVPEQVELPEPRATGVETLALEAQQVVGKHCAASGKVIAYEPDARVCPRCERVYHRAHVPESCECGMSLAELRSAAATG
jgi:hypothetical protein